MKPIVIHYDTIVIALEHHLKSLSLIDDNQRIYTIDGIEEEVIVTLKKE